MKKIKDFIKNNKATAGMIALVAGILLVSGYTFFFDSDEGGVTGWETIKQEGPNFWFGVLFGSVGAAVVIHYLVKKLTKSGGVGVGYGSLIAVAVFLSVAFGKGCTDKANNAVTTEKGRPNPVQVDSSRVPAEDLLPKK